MDSVKGKHAESHDDILTSPSIKASINDGMSNSVMMGCGESYFGVFSIFLKATTLQVGLIATLPQLLGAVMQWAGAVNMDRVPSRRKAVRIGALTQSLTLIPIALLPFIFSGSKLLIILLLMFVIIYQVANGAVVPVLWLGSVNVYYLVLIQVYGGIIWSGFNLAIGNFLFDAVTPPKRARCVAYQGLINGVSMVTGSLLGGFTTARLPLSLPIGPLVWRPASVLPMVFLMSGIIRFLAACIFLKKFREVRDVEPIGHGELIFRISHIKPLAGSTFSLTTDLFQHNRKKEEDY